MNYLIVKAKIFPLQNDLPEADIIIIYYIN
jgi:hypothetical protein